MKRWLSAVCHCGRVRVDLDRKPGRIVDCNCSICGRYGARWCYTNTKRIRLQCKPSDLVSYSWGGKSIQFKHCRHCGCVVFYEKPIKHERRIRVGVNTRMMKPADLEGVRVRRLDGAKTWKYLD